MNRCLVATAILLVAVCVPALAQGPTTCAAPAPTFPPAFVPGANTADQPTVTRLIQFDDRSGLGRTEFAAGYFPNAGIVRNAAGDAIRPSKASFMRREHGVWKSMGTTELDATAGQGRALLVADLGPAVPGGPFLYAAGVSRPTGGMRFIDSSGHQVSEGLARWDGSTWQPVGDSVSADVYDIEVFNDATGPTLYAAGRFQIPGQTGYQQVAKWSGGEWTPLSTWPTTLHTTEWIVYDLHVHDDGTGPALYAAGTMNDPPGTLQGVAKLVNGSWQQVPKIVPSTQGIFTHVSSLVTYNDGSGPSLYAAGSFTLLNNAGAGIARFTGADWVGVAGGLRYGSTTEFRLSVVPESGAGSVLYVAGAMTGMGSGTTPLVQAGGLGKWNGTAWSAPAFLSVNGSTTLAAAYFASRLDLGDGPGLYFGGTFNLVSPTAQPLGVTAYGVARIKDGEIQSLASGLGVNTNQSATRRYGLFEVDLGQGPRLAAVGSFSLAGGRVSTGVSLYDGVAWQAFPPLPGLSLSDISAAVAWDPGDGQARRLFVSHRAGIPSVFSWTGQAWGAFPTQGAPIVAQTMVVFNDPEAGGETLYIANTSGVRRWNRVSSQWEIPPGDTITNVTTLLVGDLGSGSELFASGVQSSPAPFGPGVFRRTNAGWSRIGTATFSVVPGRLAIANLGQGPRLFASGGGNYGSLPTTGVSVFDGTGWVATGAGAASSFPDALASFDDGSGPALFYGGNVRVLMNVSGVCRAFQKYQRSAWSSLCSRTSSISLAPLTIDDMAVVRLNGRPRLFIAGNFGSSGFFATPADNLVEYVAATAPCVADVDDGSGTGRRDCGVTIDDLLYYVFAFSTGSLDADVDDGSGTGHPDGGVTIDDFTYYVTRFESGC